MTQDGNEDERRHRQMLQLRQLCLPPLCLLLHQVLHTTKRYKECVQIADCVTDEQHQLYKVPYLGILSLLMDLTDDLSLN